MFINISYLEQTNHIPMDNRINYSANNNAHQNKVLKWLLSDFENFDENKNYIIDAIIIAFDNPYSTTISKFENDQNNGHFDLKITNKNDLKKLIYYFCKFNAAAYELTINIKIVKNSHIEKLVRNFLPLLRYRHIKLNFPTPTNNDILALKVILPAITFLIYSYTMKYFISKELLNINGKLTKKFFEGMYNLITLIIAIPVIIISCLISHDVVDYVKYLYFSDKREIELKNEIEKSVTFRQFIGNFGLESDLAIFEKLNGNRKIETYYINVEATGEKDRFIISSSDSKERIEEHIPFTVLPQDVVVNNIMANLSGTKEVEIMKDIIEKKKSPEEGIEELKQTRLQSILNKTVNSNSLEQAL